MKKLLSIGIITLLVCGSLYAQEPRFSSRQNKDWSESVDAKLDSIRSGQTVVQGEVQTAYFAFYNPTTGVITYDDTTGFGGGGSASDSAFYAVDFSPTSSVTSTEGRVYYDSDDDYLKVYNGTGWDTLNETDVYSKSETDDNISDSLAAAKAAGEEGVALKDSSGVEVGSYVTGYDFAQYSADSTRVTFTADTVFANNYFRSDTENSSIRFKDQEEEVIEFYVDGSSSAVVTIWEGSLTTNTGTNIYCREEIVGNDIMMVDRFQVLYSNTSETNIESFSPGNVIWDIQLLVTTAFNGTGTDLLDVGTGNDGDRFLVDEDLSTTGFKTLSLSNVPDSNTTEVNDLFTFQYTDANSDATAGEAYLYIHYSTH